MDELRIAGAKVIPLRKPNKGRQMPASYATHRKQLELILRAWGMAEESAASTAEIMSWADLHGIDTHGISMVPPYDERRRSGRIDMRAQPTVIRETPVSALIDGGSGLGHANARRAMELAIDKAKATGIGVAAVRNSAHFGACGFYALMAVEAGLIGMVTTSASGIQVAPTFGAQARLGTDPIAFAAPGKPGEPFLLDMATTTVAAGKIRNKANENLPAPPGWLVTAEGKPSTDPREVSKGGFMTPLGGTPEGSSHKGYGLSTMVNILSAALSGASMITDPLHTTRPGTMGIGHFLLALDPGLFRDAADFRADVAAFCDTLRATKPADPGRPVLVAGDPERRTAERRRQTGIPVGPNLLAKVREVAIASGADWIMDG
jgi:LDH2 family malate/lactate/ureidoglycolate dehydrogenase